MSATTARRSIRAAGLALVAVWTAWSLVLTGRQLSGYDPGDLLRPPATDVGYAYSTVARAEAGHPGAVAVAWLLPGDHQYRDYWLDYHLRPGPVLHVDSVAAATASAPAFIVVVFPIGAAAPQPAGYRQIVSERVPYGDIAGFERLPA